MSGGAAFRGQPLLLLAVLLLGWTGVRVALWDPPVEPPLHAGRIFAAGPRYADAPAGAHSRLAGTSATTAGSLEQRAQPWSGHDLPAALPPLSWSRPAAPGAPVAAPAAWPQRPSLRAVIGHNLLLSAGLAQMEVPAALLAYLQPSGPAARGIPAAAPPVAMLAAEPSARGSGSRWSADGWLLVRRDTASPVLAGRPSYGRSQAGAVVRYRLMAASALRPQVYLRASSALAGAREHEVAAGLSARPVAGLPVRLAAEARVSETARGTRVRPALYGVTELPPLDLPFGARGEAYLQGGYVGGDHATGFIDGQARIERPVARWGDTELSAGAGAWGGVQKDAARLDVGPTAAVTFRLGDARGRVAADYRFRVAGDAEPKSGPALTVSAGF